MRSVVKTAAALLGGVLLAATPVRAQTNEDAVKRLEDLKALPPSEQGALLAGMDPVTLAETIDKVPPEGLVDLMRSLLELPLEQRRATVTAVPKPVLEKLFRTLPTAGLVELGHAAAKRLGTYHMRLVKRERVKGKLNEPQTLDLTVREAPLGIRLEFVGGPPKGRKAVYSAERRKDEFRVREAGVLGVVPLWLKLDNPLTRNDTNHPVTDLAFSSTMNLIGRVFEAAKPMGGFARQDEGFDAQGRWRMVFTAPESAKGLYATKAVISFDPVLALPLHLEIEDAKGPLEQFDFSQVVPVKSVDLSDKL
jgi:hypothetical protein